MYRDSVDGEYERIKSPSSPGIQNGGGHVHEDFQRDHLLSDFNSKDYGLYDYSEFRDDQETGAGDHIQDDDEDSTLWTTLPPETQVTYGNGTLFSLGLNYIVGTGVFSLPFAFYSAGLLLTGVSLILVAAVSVLTIFYVLECLARAEGITRSLEVANAHADSGSNPPRPRHHITFRKFDYSRLCDVFASVPGRLFSQFVMTGYCFGILLSYVSVFASSTSNIFYRFVFQDKCDIYISPTHGCHTTYYVTLVIFACIVIPLTWFDLPRQAKLQMFMTIYRLGAFSIMLVTVIVGLFFPNPFAVVVKPNGQHSTPSSDDLLYPAFTGLAVWGGFQYVFTSGAVALNMHYTIPDMVQPVRDKRRLRRVLFFVILVVLFFYLAVGSLSATFFGAHTEPLVTLNWQNFTGLRGGWAHAPPGQHRKWYATVIQFVVMMFPVLDVISVFPLVSITLGNNLLATCPTALIQSWDERFGPAVVKMFFRGLATIPPIIVGGTVNQLDRIFKITGLFGFWLQIFIPCVLQLWSRWWCNSVWGAKASRTPYTSHISRSFYILVALSFGVALFALALLDVIDEKLIREWFHG